MSFIFNQTPEIDIKSSIPLLFVKNDIGLPHHWEIIGEVEAIY